MSNIRDIQHRFQVNSRGYIVEVCGCGDHPVAEPVTTFDSIVYTCVPDDLLDHEDDEPEKVVRQVFEHVHPLLPAAIDVDQWGEFTDKVLAWVCEHRAAAALRDHG